ncbi:MAG TPA: hypothetical protein VJZ76_00560, partial [Thermoanaerobaculia bacterium]|nr:hypothetical protein [Thermoanaerobaculia bacterium]
ESLAPSVKPLLDALGLDLERDGHLPCYGHRSTWGSDVPVEMCFDFNPYGHGWHLDRARFEERLAELAGCPRLLNTRIVDVESGWRVITDRETILADFLIDATGRRAALARRLGARIVRDDTLFAHVFFIDRGQGTGNGGQVEPYTENTTCAPFPVPCPLIDDTYTTIEAAEDGWWYRAPVPNGRTVAMFVSDHRVHDAHIVDASSARLDRVTGDRWLAIGDAATALDPLSSHGLGNALFTGMRAAEAIATGDFAAYEHDVGVVWSAYVSRRRELYAQERRWPSSPFWSKRYIAPA